MTSKAICSTRKDRSNRRVFPNRTACLSYDSGRPDPRDERFPQTAKTAAISVGK